MHACTLPDGRQAVLKVQRPGIRELFTADLRITWRLARLAEKAFGQRDVALGQLREILEIDPTHPEALDELERQLRLADDVVRHKLIRLPDAEAERRGMAVSA